MDSVYYARRIELQQKRVDEMQREVSAARRAHQVFQGNKSPKIIMSKIRDDEVSFALALELLFSYAVVL